MFPLVSGWRSSGREDFQASVFIGTTETSSLNTPVTYTAIVLLLAAECLCVPMPMLLNIRAIASATASVLHAVEGHLGGGGS